MKESAIFEVPHYRVMGRYHDSSAQSVRTLPLFWAGSGLDLGTNDDGAMNNPPWHGPDGRTFQQTADADGLVLFEDAVVAFLKDLRRYNTYAKLVWVYGMIDGPLGPKLEAAVERFHRETGDQGAYYLSLDAATDETMGSRQHPGPLCHQAAAKATAGFLKTIL